MTIAITLKRQIDDDTKAIILKQHFATNSINSAAKVVITTIQRLYSMLKGETEFDAANEDGAFA